MTIVNLPKNSSNTVGQPNNFSDVESNDNAILTAVNGGIENENIASAAGITGTRLASSFLEDVGVNGTGVTRRGVTSIATEQTTTSTTFTTLTTPDQVANVVLPTDGKLIVSYRALWKLTGASNAAQAAIFLGSNQTKIAVVNGVPSLDFASLNAVGDNYGLVATAPVKSLSNIPIPGGLSALESTTSDSSFVTTGMAAGLGGPLEIEAAAGTYTVSIRFHVNATSGGTLSVKERKLWVKAEGY